MKLPQLSLRDLFWSVAVVLVGIVAGGMGYTFGDAGKLGLEAEVANLQYKLSDAEGRIGQLERTLKDAHLRLDDSP